MKPAKRRSSSGTWNEGQVVAYRRLPLIWLFSIVDGLAIDFVYNVAVFVQDDGRILIS